MTCNKKSLSWVLLFSMLVMSAPAFGYEWEARQGLQGWGSSNVRDVRFTGDGLTFYRQLNGFDMMLWVPQGMVTDASFTRLRLRTLAIDSYVVCTLMSQGRVVASQEAPLYGGRGWKEYVFDFTSLESDTPVDAIAFRFALCDSVEIRDLIADGPSFSEIYARQGFRAYNVNFLHPFKLYGYSLNLWFYALILISGLGVAVWYSVTRKKGAPAILGIVFLICYFAMDIREVLEELSIMKTTYEDHVSAAPEDRRFHWSDNLVEFSAFIQRHIQPGQEEVYFFGEESRYLYMRYLLYPMKLVQKKETLARVNIFSESDNARLMGNTLFMNGKVTLENGMGMLFSPRSFLYLTK